MKVRELRIGLESLQETLSKLQGKPGMIKDINLLSTLLSSHDDLTVAQFCKKVEKSLIQKSSISKKSRAKVKKVNDQIVKKYVEQLEAIDQGNSKGFSSIITELKEDKNALVNELNKIVECIVGTVSNTKSKNEAIKSLEKWYFRKSDLDRRMQRTSGIF